MLRTETLGRDADLIRPVRDVMVRPAQHESQVTWRKLQRVARIFEPEPGPALHHGMQGQLDRPRQAQSPGGRATERAKTPPDARALAR